MCLSVNFRQYILYIQGHAVAGWGTALQVRRSQFLLPMVSLEFFMHYGPGVQSASNRKEHQENFLAGRGARCPGPTTLPLSYVALKCGNLNLLKPSGPWPVQGLLYLYICVWVYTGCPRRNVPDFGRVFLMLKYTDITQNTYVQSWTVTEIMAREKCGLLAGPRTVPVSRQVLPMFVLECGVRLRKVSSH